MDVVIYVDLAMHIYGIDVTSRYNMP